MTPFRGYHSLGLAWNFLEYFSFFRKGLSDTTDDRLATERAWCFSFDAQWQPNVPTRVADACISQFQPVTAVWCSERATAAR